MVSLVARYRPDISHVFRVLAYSIDIDTTSTSKVDIASNLHAFNISVIEKRKDY